MLHAPHCPVTWQFIRIPCDCIQNTAVQISFIRTFHLSNVLRPLEPKTFFLLNPATVSLKGTLTVLGRIVLVADMETMKFEFSREHEITMMTV